MSNAESQQWDVDYRRLLRTNVNGWNEWRAASSPDWVDLRGVDLRGINLGGADLHGADLSGAHLGGADLRGTNLMNAAIHNAYLVGADLRGAYVRFAYVRDTYLCGADLRGANLDQSNFKNANLAGALLNGATIDRTNFEGANLQGVDFDQVVRFADPHDAPSSRAQFQQTGQTTPVEETPESALYVQACSVLDRIYSGLSFKTAIRVRGITRLVPSLLAYGWLLGELVDTGKWLFSPIVDAVIPTASPAQYISEQPFVPPLGLSQPAFTSIIFIILLAIINLMTMLFWSAFIAQRKSTKAAELFERFGTFVLGVMFGAGAKWPHFGL